MKKIILSVLVLSLVLFVSCGDKSKKDTPAKPEVKEEVAEVDPMKKQRYWANYKRNLGR